MRTVTLAVVTVLLTIGTATAQTPAVGKDATAAAAAPAKAAPRTERVCESQPIANSRLKTKKVCRTRAEHDRLAAERKLMVRESLERGSVQANQNGG